MLLVRLECLCLLMMPLTATRRSAPRCRAMLPAPVRGDARGDDTLTPVKSSVGLADITMSPVVPGRGAGAPARP